MPGKGKNLIISLLKSAQRCWRLGIDINLILRSQGLEGKFLRCLHWALERSIQWIRGKMGPHRINHLLTDWNPKGSGFVTEAATRELGSRKLRKCRKSSGSTWVWSTNLKLQGGERGSVLASPRFPSSQEASEGPEASQHLATTVSWDKAWI